MRTKTVSYIDENRVARYGNKKSDVIIRLISFLCVFMYFMSPYRFLGHAMPETVGAIAILLLLTQTGKFIILKGYGAFMLYMFFIPPWVSFLTHLPGNYLTSFIPTNLIFYSFALCFLLPNTNKNYVLKYYKILVYCSIGLFLIQEISFYAIGRRPTFYLPLEMYYEGSNAASFSESRSLMNRSSSFFLEPAHFAQYILPYFCIVSYNCIKNKTITIELVINGLTLLLLRSGSGYVGLLVVFISIIFSKGIVNTKTKITIIGLVLILVSIISIVFYNNVYVLQILSRMDEITTLEVHASGSQSGFLRIWRGYIIYDTLAPIYKLFGVGSGSIEYVSNLVYIPGSRYEGGYMNGIQTILITGGIIGTLLFFRFIKKCWNFFNQEGIIVLVCMIAMFFIENMMFTPKMFLFILIAFAVTETGKMKEMSY